MVERIIDCETLGCRRSQQLGIPADKRHGFLQRLAGAYGCGELNGIQCFQTVIERDFAGAIKNKTLDGQTEIFLLKMSCKRLPESRDCGSR